ncbi:vacuolar protein sorting-associated protein 11 homolog [Eurosta solidaginis]|uniref:vacuolar protein sorting-associated protein 11 homolog n=1 Tax=Eurosta solidaginis TaxID=178769 RepID=UPI00353060E5
MSVLEWKSYDFYDLVLLSDLCKFHVQSKLIAHCANGDIYVFCEDIGRVHVCFRNVWIKSFRQRCSDIRMCTLTSKNEYLVLVSQIESESKLTVEVLSIFSSNYQERLTCVGSANLQIHGRISTLRASVFEKGSICISIGLDTGDLLLHKSVISLNLTPNFNHISFGKTPIIGIEFHQKNDVHYLFVASEDVVRLYSIADFSKIGVEIILESPTLAISCCTRQNLCSNSFLLVAREDAVYCFTTDGRGPCYAIRGKKKAMASLKQNIVILTKSEETQSNVIIIDVYHKMIVFQKDFRKTTNMIVTNKISCYMLIGNVIYITIERSIQSKLQMLMNANLFMLALSLLEDVKRDFHGYVLLKYGDFFLHKGDDRSAIIKYRDTSILVDPYVIIKKISDSKYNSNLFSYLGHILNTGETSATLNELFKSCGERIDSSKEHRVVYNRLSRTLLTFLNCVNAVLENNFNELGNSFRNEIIVNCPKVTSHYWQNIFRVLKMFKNPESFIPLLIASEENCIEFLKYSALSSGRSILAFSILLEQSLSEWRNKRKCSLDILQLLENFWTRNLERILILFVNNSFWPGFFYLNQHFKISELQFKSCINYSDCPSNFKKIAYFNQNTTAQTYENFSSNSRAQTEFAHKLFGTLSSERKQTLLKVARRISAGKCFKVLHVKQIFCVVDPEKTENTSYETKLLQNCLQSLSGSLLNFKICPIEFRENICVICKLNLRLPTIYFLCQHALHVECIVQSLVENICPICSSQASFFCDASRNVEQEMVPNKTINHISVMLSKRILSSSI